MSVVPDPTPDLVTAARRELVEQKTAELVAAGVGPPVQITDSPFALWVLTWETHGITVQGLGCASVVIAERAGWTGPNRHNTSEFPRIQVEIYADVDRERGLPDRKTAQARAKDVFRIIDRVFHRPDAGGFYWGDANGELRVVSSLRGQEPETEPVPDGDGAQRLLVSYNVELG